jgi:hypothetical protein
MRQNHAADMTPGISMYEFAMGECFGRLAAPVQRFHRLSGHHVLHGEVKVHAPVSILARLQLDAHPSTETWTRHFPANVLTSTLQLDGRYLVEKLGATHMTFELSESNGQLHLRLCRLKFLGIPCPAWLMPIIVAEESGRDDRLHFHVSVQVRPIGMIARYQGHLLLASGGAA